MLSRLAWAFSSPAIGDSSLDVVHKLLIAVAALVAGHRLSGTQASVAVVPGP